MTELRTDEEQAEMLKRWWDENGKGLLASVLIVAGGWVGWNFWEDQQQATGEAASSLYASMTEQAAAASAGDQAAQQEAILLAEQLQSEFEGSTYSQFASLFLARFAADNGDLDAAAAELQALVDSAEAPVSFMAKARLAAILVAQDKPDQALSLVSTLDDPAYASQYLEARGDALYRKGDNEAARAAYLEAVDAATELGLDSQPLQRKADFLIAGDA